MLSKKDIEVGQAYREMIGKKENSLKLNETIKTLENQNRRVDKNYNSIMSSYKELLSESSGLDKYREFLKKNYDVSTFMQLPDDKKEECKREWEKIKKSTKEAKEKESMIRENDILERASQIKKEKGVTWYEAKKQAEKEVYDMVQEGKKMSIADKWIKKLKGELKEDEEEKEDEEVKEDEEEKDYKKIAEQILKEFDGGDDADFIISKTVKLPDSVISKSGSKYWSASPILDIVAPTAEYKGDNLNFPEKYIKKGRNEYILSTEIPPETSDEDILNKIKKYYFNYMKDVRNKANGTETNYIDDLTDKDKDNIIKQMVVIKRG